MAQFRDLQNDIAISLNLKAIGIPESEISESLSSEDLVKD